MESVRKEIEQLLTGKDGMEKIDLRSDTVSWPPAGMRAAMAVAQVGDDVYEEDPTVIALEKRVAELLGKEAALLLSSGTQGNLVGILSQCARGDEMILADQSHVMLYEAGGTAALGGVFPRTVRLQADGTMRIEDLRAAIRPRGNVHYPPSRMIVLENSQACAQGVAVTADYVDSVGALAREHGLRVHMDGARLFHAAAALHVAPASLVRGVDSVSVCLSKGLCCPVGALLVADRETIARARHLRKMIGGGTRQAGVLAAAGLWALDNILPGFEMDVKRAVRLAGRLQELPWLKNVVAHTNLVFLEMADGVQISAEHFEAHFRSQNIVVDFDSRIRLAIYFWIDDRAVDTIIQAFQDYKV